jgi:hypothetical protein
MNIQVFDIKGRLVSDRSIFPFKNFSDIAWSISINTPGGYIVNILVDEYVINHKETNSLK